MASPSRRLLGFLVLAGWPVLVAVTILELVLLVEPTAIALVTGALVGRLAEAGNDDQLTEATVGGGTGPILAILATLLVTGNALRALSRPLIDRVSWRIDAAVRRELTSRVLALPTLDRVENAALQDSLATMRSPILTWMDEGLGRAAVERFRSALTMIGLVTAMLVLCQVVWWWGPATAAVALLLGRFRSGMWRHFFGVIKETMPAALRGQAWLAIMAGNRDAKEVRIFGLNGWLQQHADDNIAHVVSRVVAAREALLRRELAVFLGWAATASLVYVAVANSGAMSVGRIAATIGAVSAMFVISMTSQGEDMDEVVAPALESITRIRQVAPSLEPAPPPSSGNGEICLTEVFFAYGEVRVLNGVTLTLGHGEVVAIVGVNGAGKTTLAKLLTSQYRPGSGTMVTEPAAYAVYQDFNRYELSAYENIRIAAPEATREQVEAAAAAVGATAMIERLPHGWATVLSPKYADGGDLSGGQWQKIALARAVLAAATGARLLVLDEPTANLDIEAEFEAFERISQARGAATVVLISHRFSTVRKADRIVVLSGGRITEDGSHAELLAAGGEYARMFSLQAQQFQEAG